MEDFLYILTAHHDSLERAENGTLSRPWMQKRYLALLLTFAVLRALAWHTIT